MLDARSSFQCARFMRNSSSSSSVALSSPPSSACLLLLLISFLKIFCHLSPTNQLVVEGVDIPPYFLFHIRLPIGECQETAQ